MGKRIAVVEKDKCFPDKCGNYLCKRLCPVNRTGAECIIEGSDGRAFINENLCTGCGICPKRCPFGAIHIINLPEMLIKDPIIRYGADGFMLFNLPVPAFGKVVGLIGRNGIGKSTAIKLLAGMITPNFGKVEGYTFDFQDLISYFKGTEAQYYFEKLRAGEIVVSYKPQQVELIPKTTKGTVLELLKSVDERRVLPSIIKDLDLSIFLENEIETLSGGELQRVAIAATVLKKANVYIFDEPTSFLDIKQRILVSRFIRNLATSDTSVLVVEHDLVILDYMTDLVHLLYGQAGAYGIVSGPKTSRVGINVYLSGFLREENMRFRDHEIKFEKIAKKQRPEDDVIISWEDIVKTLGKFSLHAPSGKISRGRIMGVLGENGIGKTTFVKILAGALAPDTGSVSTKVKVAYKPQYLDNSSTELVQAVVEPVVGKYKSQLIDPLRLDHLYFKQVNQLSGGELQKVAIALCLAKDASLYLMDEPSAYLDVEQRLEIAKIIRDFMEQKGTAAIIVDHDLVFLDHFSTDLLVGEGQPALHGRMEGPYSMEEGMNNFLEDLSISLRRDETSHRPRINKEGSRLDREQKKSGKRFYS